MRSLLPGGPLRAAARLPAVGAFVFFLMTAFRAGWMRPATDFPNYYTAAVLARRHEPETLRLYYDWTWFQRQMNFAGYERQLGSYAAQTPLTMLPMLVSAAYPPQTGKRIWISASLIFLVATVWLLSRVTGTHWEYVTLLAACGYNSLYANFLFGQYYVFLLFLLTLTCYCLARGGEALSGVLGGVSSGLKLYGTPLLLYFGARREWRALAYMAATTTGLAALAIALFGWNDVIYYLTRVLPRSLAGGSIDPYNPANATLSTLLRRSFLREPELNPDPLLDAPRLFFFLRPLTALGIAALATAGVASTRSRGHNRDFAWFMICILLLSTSTASYTSILLLLPVTLLVAESPLWKRVLLVIWLILLNAPLHPLRLFPKVWLLLLMFVTVGWDYWRSVKVQWLACAAVLVVGFSGLDAVVEWLGYREEPGRRYRQIAVEPGALLSSFPAITRDGLFYEGIRDNRYVLCWMHGGRIERFDFDGLALHPVAPTLDGPVWFELVRNRTSTMMRFEPRQKTAVPSALPAGYAEGPAKSPDGKWIAFTQAAGSEQIWLRNTATGRTTRLTGGYCNSAYPAWEADSGAIVFASDCGRAFGLPALYRAPIGAAGPVEVR